MNNVPAVGDHTVRREGETLENGLIMTGLWRPRMWSILSVDPPIVTHAMHVRPRLRAVNADCAVHQLNTIGKPQILLSVFYSDMSV